MLTLIFVTIFVLIVSYVGLALFSFVAGLLSPLAEPSYSDNPDEPDERFVTDAGSFADAAGPPDLPSEARQLAAGVLANFVAFGLLLLLFAGLIVLLRSFGL